jgi:hypothetical protein
MENLNNNNNFEQFLRSSIEDFKMIPARKVWHGIYNNMHPDRRWPSITVCLLILTCIMYVGVANNNSINNSSRKNTEENLLASAISPSTEKNTVVQNIVSVTAQNIPAQVLNNYTTAAQRNHIANTENSKFVSTKVTTASTISSTNNTTGINKVLVSDDELMLKTNNSIANNIKENQTQSLSEVFAVVDEEKNVVSIITEEKNIEPINENSSVKNNTIVAAIENDAEPKTIAKNNIPLLKDAIAKNTAINYEEKSWTEDYAFRNKPRINKLKEFGSVSYYVTPSVGYRTLTQLQQNGKAAVFTSSFAASSNSITTNETMKDVYALNLEAGAVYQYQLSKNIRLKTGLQANYTNYISKATELLHPTQTSLAVIGIQNTTRSSLYSTEDGGTNLNKTTWQVALPIGLDIKLAGNDKLKWYIGATAQPTYILSGSAIVLSADAKNYITENSFLRRWNLNTAIETFVSFKPSAGITLNVGPQFRYQILSSYKKTYNYTEKLYNVGVKVGLTTNF